MKIHIYNKYFLIHLILLIPLFGYSQNTITGRVVTANKEPAFGASVGLFLNGKLVDGKSINDLGKFSFRNISAGTYKITIRRIGSVLINKKISVKDSEDIDLGDIILLDDVFQLKGLVVKGSKKIIEYKNDKTILNIKGTPLSREDNISEALNVLPGVSYSTENKKLTVMGKGRVEVWINGRKSNMSISSIPANIVNSAEIISNPSAKYDSSVDAIVNLKLDKWKLQGIRGEAYLKYGQGRFPHYAGKLSLSYNHNRFSIETNIGYNAYKFLAQDLRHTKFLNISPKKSQFSNQNQTYKRNYSYGNVDISYALSKQETIALNLGASFPNTPNQTVSQRDDFYRISTPNVIDSTYISINVRNNKRRRYNTDISYINEFKKDKGSLKIASSYFNSRFEDNHNYEFTEIIASNQDKTTSLFYKKGNTDGSIFSSIADVSLKVGDNSFLDFGGKITILSTSNNSNLKGDIKFIYDNIIKYKFKENVYATYLNWSKTIKKLDLSLGLRGEYFDNDGEFNKNKSSQHGFDFFPSASLSYSISNKHKIITSYSRKIKRVNVYQRTPNRFFFSPFVVLEGNPELQPQFSHNIEATYIYNRKYPFKIYYSKVDDYIRQETYYNGIIGIAKPINYDTEELGFSTSIPIRYTSWWNGIHKLTFRYQKNYGAIKNIKFDNSMFSYNIYIKQYFDLWDFVDISLTAKYKSPRIKGSIRFEYNPSFNLSFNKTFFNNRLRIGINCIDVFNTYGFRAFINSEDVIINKRGELEIRRVDFSIKYSFGEKRKAKKKNSNTILEEEKLRISN